MIIVDPFPITQVAELISASNFEIQRDVPLTGRLLFHRMAGSTPVVEITHQIDLVSPEILGQRKGDPAHSSPLPVDELFMYHGLARR